MKIKITRNTVIAGFQGAKVGDVINVPDDIGRDMIASGRAVRFIEVPPAAVIETREPEVESRDPEPEKQKRKRSRLY